MILVRFRRSDKYNIIHDPIKRRLDYITILEL